MAFVYEPSRFMLETSHYDKAKADRAVKFIQNLCHTKGKWDGTIDYLYLKFNARLGAAI